MEQLDTAIGPRTRKTHSRSRLGCLTCKQRHKRCDEGRPVCGNCLQAKRACEFAAPSLTLKERRTLALPGQQQPWVIDTSQPQASSFNIVIDTNPVDPFDCLPVKMSLKSKELLYYFSKIHKSGDTDADLGIKQPSVLPFACQTANDMRDTLLVAATHYLWRAADPSTFKSTVIFHKLGAIRSLNEQLENPKLTNFSPLIKRIATLALIEIAVGNIAVAETHLNGLIAVLNINDEQENDLLTPMEFEEELAYRYLMLAVEHIRSTKGRMRELQNMSEKYGQPRPTLTQFVSIVLRWSARDIPRFDAQLKAITLFPFFFAPPPSSKRYYNIDGTTVVQCLKSLTKSVTSLRRNGPPDAQTIADAKLLIERAVTGIQYAASSAHVLSLTEDPDTNQIPTEKLTSWCGIIVSSGLYLDCVLEPWSSGMVLDYQTFRRIVVILARDLAQTGYTTKDGPSKLWFWEHFVGAYSLATQHSNIHDRALQVAGSYFNRSIRHWSQRTGITDWKDARECLHEIAWSTNHPQTLAQWVWRRAVAVGPTQPHPGTVEVEEKN